MALSPMAADSSARSVRIQVDLNTQTLPVIFSYKELYKRAVKTARPATPPAVDIENDAFLKDLLERAAKYDMNDDEADDDDDSEDDPPLHDGKKRAPADEYDYEDPFIDDSDMLLDQPYDYELPECDSFFVFKGPLEGPEAALVLKDERDRRTRSGASNSSAPNPSISKPKQPKGKGKAAARAPPAEPSPAVIEISDGESGPDSTIPARPAKKPLKSQKRTIPTPWSGSSHAQLPMKKRKTASEDELPPLDPPILADYLKKLKKDATDVNFEPKSAFPEVLRPTVIEAGIIVFRQKNRADYNFISHLKTVLPYNRFTLTKFLTTKVGPKRVNELNEECKELQSLLMEKTHHTQQHETQSDQLDLDDDTRDILYKIIDTQRASIDIINSIAECKKNPASAITKEDAEHQICQLLFECWPAGRVTMEQLAAFCTNVKNVITVDDDMVESESTCTPILAGNTNVHSLAVKDEQLSRSAELSSFAMKYPLDVHRTSQ